MPKRRIHHCAYWIAGMLWFATALPGQTPGAATSTTQPAPVATTPEAGVTPVTRPAVTPPAIDAAPAVCTTDDCRKEANAAYGRTTLMMTAALAAGSLLLLISLGRSNAWSLGGALAEKGQQVTRSTDANGLTTETVQPVATEGSASRLIAAFGLLVLATVILGVGYALVWSLFVHGRLPQLDGIGTYLLGGSSLFAPYAFNQLKEVFTPAKKP